jgi:response regulator RpfG family c-di-GMP phosphodiesterase
LEALILSIEQNSLYDLLVFNVIMPLVTGIQLIGHIRSKEKERSIKNLVKIIVTSGLDDYKSISEKYDIKWLQKPINIQALRNIVKLIQNNHNILYI